MSNLIDTYGRVIDHVKDINDRIANVEKQISEVSHGFSQTVGSRIEKLEESIEKVDEYVLKIKAFQEQAKKNLTSQNVLTIEAPPGYRVNLNRLRNWAMMIDPQSDNDPYAQRVLIVAKCDECFLEKKRKEFTQRIELLKKQQIDGADEEVKRLRSELADLREERRKYALSQEMYDFANAVVAENKKSSTTTVPNSFIRKDTIPAMISPGAFLAPLAFEKEQRLHLHAIMGDCYDADRGLLCIPTEIPNSTEYVMNITCAPRYQNNLYQALQGLLLSSIDKNPSGARKVYFIDAARFKASSIGSLKELEDSFYLDHIPRTPDQVTESLERIVSSFADMDEMLDIYDSVSDYNKSIDDISKCIPMSTVVLLGWPSCFEGRNLELAQRIMINYERYGISIVTVSFRNSESEKQEDTKMPEFAQQSAIKVSMCQKDATIAFPGGNPQRFSWYSFSGELPSDYVSSLKNSLVTKEAIGSVYTKRYPMEVFPDYTREYKKIVLPFGIDGSDNAQSISFEDENFAAYLVGASRSGKSTLLHTLIAGMIYGYHPDNLEIWLADFKQLEFKRYINHLPPHVKYVLLDESTELVFDLIDKLTNEMMERQKLFSRLGVQRINQVDVTKLDHPLPVIFVILDEFSIMSQAIADSPYQIKLQNILAKGAALGIKFLFSSQTFTSGVRGLTKTARAQIQQRIAMKGSKEEISETLELSSNLKTEQVKNWMDALPPHYALVKFRLGADTLPVVKRYLVMYFPDYAVRDDMIEMIGKSMSKSEVYDANNIKSFVDKHPVLVDGNSLEAYPRDTMVKNASGKKQKDEIDIVFGTPRLMEPIKYSTLTRETRENILLVGRMNESACIASIIFSVIKSCLIQRKKVEIWTYERSQIFTAYKDVLSLKDVPVSAGIDAVCKRIKEMKKQIKDKKTEDRMIILLGMERICMDFSYLDTDSSDHESKVDIMERVNLEKGAVAESLDDQIERKLTMAWHDRIKEIELQNSDKSNKKIQEIIDNEEKEFLEKKKAELIEKYQNSVKPTVKPASGSDSNGAYNALKDFQYILMQGSRLGVHFMLTLSNVNDLKTCEAKPDFFRYKMSFQLSADDSRTVHNNPRVAVGLPEHVCQFNDTFESYSFRPYLHKNIGWDGWYVDEKGQVVSPYLNNDDE